MLTNTRSITTTLWKGSRPPKIDEARAKAEALVGADAFAEALKDEKVEKMMRDGIALYQFIDAEKPPTNYCRRPGDNIGRVSQKKLSRSLDKALGF